MAERITLVHGKRASSIPRATRQQREALEVKARAFGVKRLAEALDSSYSLVSHKLSGFIFLYPDDIEVMEAVMKKLAA